MDYGKREWRDLMVSMSGPKIEGVYGRVLSARLGGRMFCM